MRKQGKKVGMYLLESSLQNATDIIIDARRDTLDATTTRKTTVPRTLVQGPDGSLPAKPAIGGPDGARRS